MFGPVPPVVVPVPVVPVAPVVAFVPAAVVAL
jgi:hypothetical protein